MSVNCTQTQSKRNIFKIPSEENEQFETQINVFHSDYTNQWILKVMCGSHWWNENVIISVAGDLDGIIILLLLYSSSSSCHQTCVFHVSTHFFAISLKLLRSGQGRAEQEGCIASCVRYFLLPDRTHTWRLLRSTPISVSVLCLIWIL